MNLDNLKVRIATKIISFFPISRGHKLKSFILRTAGIKIGKNVSIWSTAKFYSPNISIGDNSFIGFNVQLFANKGGEISIGNHCAIGTDVIINTGGHKLGPPERRSGEGYVRPIRIGDGVRISTRALIVEGVSVGSGSQVAAGAVVVRDVPPNTLVGGVPARVIKDLPLELHS